jgi:hypothetical protein
MPYGGDMRPVGMVRPFVAPSVEVAIITHVGSHTNIDLA